MLRLKDRANPYLLKKKNIVDIVDVVSGQWMYIPDVGVTTESLQN